MGFRLRLLPLLLSGALLLGGLGCGDGCSPSPPPPDVPPSPLRRLTEDELNHTLRDLFAGISLPHVTVTEDIGREFEGETSTQQPSDLVVEQLRAGMNAVSAAAVSHKDLLLPLQPTGPEEYAAAANALIDAFLPRAFRRPVVPSEASLFRAFFDERAAEADFDSALQLLLQAILQSPSFLYRFELAPTAGDGTGRVLVEPYEMASRLSYFLWASMPDQELFEAARTGELWREDIVMAQARRMLADPRAEDAILSFHRQWLEFDRILQINKDASVHPTYNETLRQSMREEANRFILDVFINDGTLRSLLTSRTTHVNAVLAQLYGIPAPAATWERSELPADRAGILTQAQFLASHAHAVDPSPVLRGVFVLNRLLCESPPQPAGNINITPPSEQDEGGAGRTNRERYRAHEDIPSCKSCHVAIDGIGFGLEGFDAIGASRTQDNGRPVDASGSLEATAVGGTFTGAAQLAQILADSDQVERCVLNHWFRFGMGRHELPVDEPDLLAVREAFRAADGDVRELLVALVASDSFRTRKATP